MKHFMCIKIDLKYSSYHRTKKNALINKFKGGGGRTTHCKVFNSFNNETIDNENIVITHSYLNHIKN